MSRLPSEYLEIEYIESTGKQFIETGYVVDENDVLELRYEVTKAISNGDNFLFASQQPNSGAGLWCSSYGTMRRWYARFGHSSSKQAESTEDQRSGVLRLSKDGFVVNGTKIFDLSYTSMPTGTLALFGRMNSDGSYRCGNMKCYGFKITRNGAVIREYKPARRIADGELGMYDTVTKRFLTNAGTGVFIAGDIVIARCMITDRTAADVERWRALQQKGYAAMTAEEKAAWNSGAMKGAYNVSDLNRVGMALNHLRDELASELYLSASAFDAKTDWKESDIPTVRDLSAYLSFVSCVRNATKQLDSTPSTPADTGTLNYSSANDIEKILLASERVLHSIRDAWFFSGDLYCGEV